MRKERGNNNQERKMNGNIEYMLLYLGASLYSSVGKESVCNAGDLGLIPGLESSPGAGVGYPLQYSWGFLVAQTVKNPPAMRENWV